MFNKCVENVLVWYVNIVCVCVFGGGVGGGEFKRYDVMDICPAKNGLCPSKNRFDRTTWPAAAGKLFQALKNKQTNKPLCQPGERGEGTSAYVTIWEHSVGEQVSTQQKRKNFPIPNNQSDNGTSTRETQVGVHHVNLIVV